jgi:hypothetical protein
VTLSNRTILKPINVWSKIIVKANSWNSNFKGISWISCWLQVVRYGHFLREGLKSYLMVPISLLSMYVKGCTFDVNKSIDYRCADGSFLMSPRGLAVSSTRYISSHETRANASIRGWKLHLSESTWCQESVGGICFTNKWRAASQQPLTLSNDGESSVISNASPGLTVCFFFWGEHRGFLKEGVKTYWMAPMCLSTRQLFFCLHIYSLWTKVPTCDI